MNAQALGAKMRVAFRCDASLQIGTGHVARCLTLAHALRVRGAQVLFICRDLPGAMGARIAAQGFDLALLPPPPPDFSAPKHPPHAHWAGIAASLDAQQSRAAIDAAFPNFGQAGDWLVMDHYAFDADWQGAVLATRRAQLAVIDDLADRRHLADLLIDQNLGRHAQDYDALLPAHCERLIGPGYALLRPEFAAKRADSLARRAQNGYPLENVLITMGGIDLANATEAALQGLARFHARLGGPLQATVVMGAQAPALAKVRALAADLPFPAQVRVDVQDMAAVMAQADLAIGAAGVRALMTCVLVAPAKATSQS